MPSDPTFRLSSPAQGFAAALELQRADQLGEAERMYEAVLALDRDHAGALHNLALIRAQQGLLTEAESLLRRAIERQPEAATLHNSLGSVLQALGRHGEAAERVAQAIALGPGVALFRVNLGKALADAGRDAEAVIEYERALALRPDNAAALNDLGNALQRLGRHDAAVGRYERALDLQPGWAVAHDNLANTLHALGRHEEALAHYRRAIAARPDGASAYANLGSALRELGRLEEARRAFAAAVERAPASPLFHLNLAELTHFESDADPEIAALEAMARREDGAAETHFALAKARADLGQHAAAFGHWRAGNARHRREIAYDEAATLRLFARIRDVFTPELMRARAGSGDAADLPIFILGMPRSGTTLVEQILASHPQVFGAGELPDLSVLIAENLDYPDALPLADDAGLRRLAERYIAALRRRAPWARHVTDKTPSHFLYVGLLRLILPQARIVHVRRDPLDTCLSCFATLFTTGQPYAYDLAELGRYYHAYDGLMAHWRALLGDGAMLEIHYEDVVADLEREARRLMAYCGLPWDDACLSFHRTQRTVRTASAAQVREPIHARSVGRSSPYRDHLGPLRDALAGAGRAAR